MQRDSTTGRFLPGSGRPIQERFWEKVNKTETCWLWIGDRDDDGYGRMHVGGQHGRVVLAHRLSYELLIGSIPPNLCVLHKCDNPPCVNPEHLFLGTRDDNVKDMVDKGRHCSIVCPWTHPVGETTGPRKHPESLRRGSKHPNARLTEDNVRSIRESHAAGVSYNKLAELHGISKSVIATIVKRRGWKHIA